MPDVRNGNRFNETGSQRQRCTDKHGIETKSTFVDAGLPEPFLRMDAVIGTASRFPYELVAGVLHSLLPTIEQLRLSTPEIEIGGLEQSMVGRQ